MLGEGRADRLRSRRQTARSEVLGGEANEGWGQRRRDVLVSEGGSESKQAQLCNNSNRTGAKTLLESWGVGGGMGGDGVITTGCSGEQSVVSGL